MSAWTRTRELPRAVKTRIREMVAHEIRQRMTEAPDYIVSESNAVINAWSDYVHVIADQISTGACE